MDLADTPTLAGLTPHGQSKDRAEAARLISAADAASPEFRAAWETLAANASQPNPFFEPWFALPAFEQFAAGANAKVLAVYESECLIGLLPAARSRRYYGYPIPHACGWLHSNAFLGAPLIARGFESDFWCKALAYFDHNAGSSAFLHLPQLPADGPVNAALEAVLREAGRPAVTVEAGERAMLASSAAPADYLAAAMSTKKRKELRRQHKRLAEEGALVFVRANDARNIGEWIEEFLAMEADGWKGEAGSALASAADTRAFFTKSLMNAAQLGRLERLTLRLDGKPIAMLANFTAPPGVFSFKTTFDEAYARFSPGLLLQIENLDLLERDGIEWADSCAAEGHSMIERIWREKRPIISRNIAIGGTLRRAVFRAMMAYEMRGEKRS